MCLQCVVKEKTFFFWCLISVWCGLSCCSPAVFCALCIDLPMDVLVPSKLWASCCGFNFLGIRIQQMIHILYMYSWPSTICYSIVLQSVLRQLTANPQCELNALYLYDGVLTGPGSAVLRALEILGMVGKPNGLILNL